MVDASAWARATRRGAQGAENSKLMKTEGLKERIGGVGNQFAMTEVLGFFISLPVMLYLEGASFSKFMSMATTDSVLQYNLRARHICL